MASIIHRTSNVALHLVVFDIDGTLVDSYGFDAALYADAIRQALGINIDTDWARYTNATDSGILDQVIEENEVEEDRETIQEKVQCEFTRLTESYIEQNASAVREIPGANAFIEHLQQIEDVALAIATGGWESTAKLKLRAIGLDPHKFALATASDAISRMEIIEIVAERSLRGRKAARKTYFGDGLWDKRASEALGYEFIGVGNRVDHHATFLDYRNVEKICTHLGV